jgi:diaminopimelate epimerase
MRFTKMQGAGNDYVYVDCFAEKMPADPSRLAREIADRHFGVGGDGLILICPSKVADARMRMFNADGSEAEMCGNGVRCVAKYVYDHGIARKPQLKIETGRGVLTLDVELKHDQVARVRVDMGEPILKAAEIPTTLPGDPPIDAPLAVPGLAGNWEPKATCVSVGNPHAVFYVGDAFFRTDGKDLVVETGPQLENAPQFPRRINVHYVKVHSPSEVTMRTWERGSGITLACGTGASAVCVAGVLSARTERKILAHLPGGDLELEWSAADNHVYMTGPAVQVFQGEWLDRT